MRPCWRAGPALQQRGPRRKMPRRSPLISPSHPRGKSSLPDSEVVPLSKGSLCLSRPLRRASQALRFPREGPLMAFPATRPDATLRGETGAGSGRRDATSAFSPSPPSFGERASEVRAGVQALGATAVPPAWEQQLAAANVKSRAEERIQGGWASEALLLRPPSPPRGLRLGFSFGRAGRGTADPSVASPSPFPRLAWASCPSEGLAKLRGGSLRVAAVAKNAFGGRWWPRRAKGSPWANAHCLQDGATHLVSPPSSQFHLGRVEPVSGPSLARAGGTGMRAASLLSPGFSVPPSGGLLLFPGTPSGCQDLFYLWRNSRPSPGLSQCPEWFPCSLLS